MDPGQSGLIGMAVTVLPAAKLDPEPVMLKFVMSIMTSRTPRRKPELVVVQVCCILIKIVNHVIL